MNLSKDIQFSVASEQDTPNLVSLINSGYRGEESRKGWTTEADFLDGDRIRVPEMLEILRTKDSVILKAETENQLYGCVYLMKKGSLSYLGMLTVKPSCQGLGLGKKLLQFAEKYVRDNWQVQGIEMTVITLREELIRFYERQGYFPTGEMRPFPYQALNPGDAKRMDLEFVVLEKTLSSLVE